MYKNFWDDADGYLRFEYALGKVFAHSIIYNWSPSVFRKAQAVWHVAKEELLEEGYKSVFVIIPKDDNKLIKFEKMFGFVPVMELEGGYLFMECVIGEENGH